MTPLEENRRKELGLDVPGAGCKNYSIKAGAGGGKTTLLSKRIANQIIQGTPIEKFVIITYTNAAAAELREKITDRLQEVIKNGNLSASQLSNANTALNSIELMQISTIHAFLFKILKEYAFESGIVIDARMLEDAEDQARKKSFFDKWYQEHFSEIEAYRSDWIYTSKDNKSSEHHHEVFENMFYDIANVREDIIYDVTDHTADFVKAAEDYLNYWLTIGRNYIVCIDSYAPSDKKGNKKLLKASLDIITMIKTVEDQYNKGIKGIDQAKELSEAFKLARKVIKNKDKYFYGKKYPVEEENIILAFPINNIPELDWNFTKLYDEFFMNSQKAAKVAEYVCKMQKEYQQMIDAETLVLSNDDILYRAERLLINNKDILEKLRNRYSKIYVDEFQDTTGLQTRIIELLSENNGADLSNIDFADDKLIVVGDSKQSIYRFTGAEKAVYDSVDSLMTNLSDITAESVTLDSNFRSNSEVVDWVNSSFNGSATGSSSGLMADYTNMSTDWIVTEKEALHGVYRYGDPEDRITKNDDVSNVVSLVKKLVNNPKYFIERVTRTNSGGCNSTELNEIQYSDIMIICKITKNITPYVDEFSKIGIPVNVQGKFQVSGDVVLKNFILLLEYFANYKNKKNRITAAQIIQGIDVSSVSDDDFAKAEKQLKELGLQFKKEGLNAASIVQKLLSSEELFVPKGKIYTVEMVRSYRIRLHQMIEHCLGKNSGDLSDLVSIMREYIKTEVKREIPLESNENALRLMNAHQSKGLTGQIVIIADRSSNEECKYGGFRKAGKYYPSASFRFSASGSASKIYRPTYGYDPSILKQVYIDEMEEAIRLQYVAATRAAHALIIMPVAGQNNIPWFSNKAYNLSAKPDILEWLVARDNDTNTYPVKSIKSTSKHPIINLNDLAVNLAGTCLDDLAKKQITSISPSGLESSGVTGYKPTDAGYTKETRPSGDVFGTVMHRVYELIFNRYASINALPVDDRKKAIERIINQAILEQADNLHKADDPQEFVDFLSPLMLNYFSKVITPIFDEAKEIYTEYKFSFFVPASDRTEFMNTFDNYFKTSKIIIENEELWVNGVADLVVIKKDGSIKVYDYKSDSKNGKVLSDFEKSLSEKYEGQLTLYKYAIGKAFNATNVEAELIHLYK